VSSSGSQGSSPGDPKGLGARLFAAPLVQFVALGLIVFGIVSWQSGSFSGGDSRDGARDDSSGPSRAGGAASSAGDQTIVVEREALLAFVQMRTQEANAEGLAATFDGLSTEARQIWIDRFVREEALVREARRLGLDREDELIRRRLVQKMEFLAEGIVVSDSILGADEIEQIYRERVEEYREPAILSFAHVFVRASSSEATKDSDAHGRAEMLLAKLNQESLSDNDAGGLGDRFLYNRRYVDRTLDEVRSHFGGTAANVLLTLSVDSAKWQGPVESDHGWHLILLTERTPSRLPDLAEIEKTLRRDLTRDRSQEALDVGLGSIIRTYQIELDAALVP
jgi:peptidyl-prolyl cis-trans isomerase C